MRMLLPVVLTACGPSGVVSTRTEHAATRIEETRDETPDGPCGGFVEAGRTEPLELLAGRLAVRAPAGAVDSPRPTSIMAAPPTDRAESRLFVDRGEARFVVFAVELFARPGEDLRADVQREVGDGFEVAALEVESPLEAVIATPTELDYEGDGVELARVYTVTPDRTVQRVDFYVTPDAALTGGCRVLAKNLARTLSLGPRRLDDTPGRHALTESIAIDLPADVQVVIDEGPDFSVYRVHPLLPFGGARGSLGIYEGDHASFEPPAGATRTSGRLFGRPVEWFEWRAEGVDHRQGLATAPSGATLHVFLGSNDRAVFDDLVRVAASLDDRPPAPALPACGPGELPAVEARAEVLSLPAVRALASATEFSFYRRTWERDRIEPTERFFELARDPRAREAFMHLAVHGTPAGKLYALAGLYLLDRPAFDRVVCAVRDTTSADVVVRLDCGTETRPFAELVETAGAVHGESFWSARLWESAINRGDPLDLRGGGVAWRLALGAPNQRSIDEAGWMIGGDGFVPPLHAEDDAARSMPAWSPDRAHPRLTATTDNGGVCRVRSDGRVACWGTTPASEIRGATVLPAPIVWPHEIAIDLGLGCVLDAAGRRSCFALLDHALEQRARDCPAAIAPTELPYRRFDDGPWQRLVVGQDVCGIRHDGSLHCFADSNRWLPQWVELSGAGIGSSYPIAIEGSVAGVIEGYLLDAWAWTTDGSIWRWTDREAPRRVARLEGVVALAAGNDGATVFATLGDGRVFVRGARRDANGEPLYYGSFGDDEGSFEEVPSLRGQRIYAGPHHACALAPGGAVSCWGQATGFAPGQRERGYDAPPEDVAILRGATDLRLGEWLTCGVMQGGSMRCIGAHVREITNGAVAEEARGPVTVDLDRIAARIR